MTTYISPQWQQLRDMSAYDFLGQEPILKHTIYATLAGSRAYGTNNANSDVDIRGVFLEDPGELLGLHIPRDYFEEQQTDTVFFGLRKFVGLAVDCNPNIIEMLGTRKQDILYMSEVGQLLRENTSLFLSKKAYITFAGYANSQLRRLENALARDHYPQPEKEKHILGSLQAEMLACREVFGPENMLNLYIDESPRDDMETEIFLDAQLKHISLRDYLRINGEFSNMLRNYGKLNKRNRKKDEPHLRKHAMHLIRLYYTGLDILQHGEIHTYRDQEHDQLMTIRNGDIDFAQVFALQKELEKQMKAAYEASSLPETADLKNINRLLNGIYKEYLLQQSV